jgi:hypothetical protein
MTVFLHDNIEDLFSTLSLLFSQFIDPMSSLKK